MSNEQHKQHKNMNEKSLLEVPNEILEKILFQVPFRFRILLRACNKRLRSVINNSQRLTQDFLIKLTAYESLEFVRQNITFKSFYVDMRLTITYTLLDQLASDLKRCSITLVVDNFNCTKLPKLYKLLPYIVSLELFFNSRYQDEPLDYTEYNFDFTRLNYLSIKFVSLMCYLPMVNEDSPSQAVYIQQHSDLFERIKIHKKKLKALIITNYCGRADYLAKFLDGLNLNYLELNVTETCLFHPIGRKFDTISFSTKYLNLINQCENRGFALGVLRYLDMAKLEMLHLYYANQKDSKFFIEYIQKNILEKAVNLKKLSLVRNPLDMFNINGVSSSIEFYEIGYVYFDEMNLRVNELIESDYLPKSIQSLSIVLVHNESLKGKFLKFSELKAVNKTIRKNLKTLEIYLNECLCKLALKYPNIKRFFIFYNDISKNSYGVRSCSTLAKPYDCKSNDTNLFENIEVNELLSKVQVNMFCNYDNTYFPDNWKKNSINE